jgi:hypothetical protein
MKALNVIALITSVICTVMAVINDDLTEALAWFSLILYNTRDLINHLTQDL